MNIAGFSAPVAPLANIDQSQHRKGAVSVLSQFPVTHLGKASNPLER